MTNEQKRIAIAESDGWHPTPSGNWTKNPSGFPSSQFPMHPSLPDYLNSRDAIVPAILRRFNTQEEKDAFTRAIQRTTLKFDANDETPDWVFLIATATAAQLADAYLAATEDKA